MRKESFRQGMVAFLRTNSIPIPRIQRLICVFDELGFSSLFIGAFREKNLPRKEEWDGTTVNRVGVYFPLVNGRRLLFYLFGIVIYNIAALWRLIKLQPSIVHISDFEPFLIVPLLKLFVRRIPIIYNIHDNLSQRYNVPKIIKLLLNHMEGLCVAMSTITLVPEEFRKKALPKHCRRKVRVIKNTPMISCGYSYRTIPENGQIKLLYAGWLDTGRGIDQLIEISINDPQVSVILAGAGDPEILEKIQNSKDLEYLGYLPNAEIVERTAECHFVYSCYDPIREINRFAASNKIAEALSAGKPIIINKEVLISDKIQKYQCGIISEYGDTDSILANLNEFRKDQERYRKATTGARHLFEDEYSWTKAKENIYDVIDLCRLYRKN